MLERTWSLSVHFVTYEICKFCCVNFFCPILLEKHYHFLHPPVITSGVTDIIRYFTVHLSSCWRMIKCWFYLLWSFPASWDMWTWINFQERMQRLCMLCWWKISCLYYAGLSDSEQEEARCVTWILKCMILRSESKISFKITPSHWTLYWVSQRFIHYGFLRDFTI